MQKDYSKFDANGVQIHDEKGHELPDATPIAAAIGYTRQPSLAEQIRQMVRSERLAQEAAAMGAETFEEADDFEVGDPADFLPGTPYEQDFDPVPVSELKARKKKAEEAEAAPPPEPNSEKKPTGGDQPPVPPTS